MPTRSMATCTRLVSEQEVQALSIDAATGNVEAHYAYICDAFQAFMQRYAQQAAAHAGESTEWPLTAHVQRGTKRCWLAQSRTWADCSAW